jgi:hypothetical protein
MKRYNELVSFKTGFGHTHPTIFKGNRQLSTWVAGQRNRYAKGKLSDACVEKLNTIGFK